MADKTDKHGRGLATNITREQRDRGLAELEVYYTWVRDNILKPDTEYNFVLLPLGRPGANYRDVVPAPVFALLSFQYLSRGVLTLT